MLLEEQAMFHVEHSFSRERWLFRAEHFES